MEYRLKIDDETISADVSVEEDRSLKIGINGKQYELEYSIISENQVHLTVNGRSVNAYVSQDGNGKIVSVNGINYYISNADEARAKQKIVKIPDKVTPPIPSVVISVLVKEGDMVTRGQNVIVISAMKMETTLKAPFDGRVISVNVSEGDKVNPGDILIDIERISE